jgi:hypothetical protein
MLLVLWLGIVWPSTSRLSERTLRAVQLEPPASASITAYIER